MTHKHVSVYDAALARIAELEEQYAAKCAEFETAKEPVFAEGMRQGCEDLMLEAARMDARITQLEAALREIVEPVYDSRGYGPLPSGYRAIARRALNWEGKS